ncbi:MAG: hypothetical protein GF349_01080 [Candidatus Magasanikbacteria bacterium]|nr:hypothetical protein [Candidatus Magasanikbacteria bacterium]
MLISAGNIISESIKLYRDNAKLFLQYMGLLFIPAAITSVLALFGNNGAMVFINLLVAIAAAVVSIWISIAFIRAVVDRYQNKKAGAIQPELQKATEMILPVVLVSILTGLAVLGGLILLIIPGIIFAVWFAFSYYIVILDNKKGTEALKASKQMVQGRWFGVFWRLLAPGIVFALLGFIAQAIIMLPFRPIMDTQMGVMLASFFSSAVALVIAPFGSAAQSILYIELKKTPAAVNMSPEANRETKMDDSNMKEEKK